MSTTAQEKRARRRKAVLETFQNLGSIKATARHLRIGRRIVRRILRGDDEPDRAPSQTTTPRPSKLDPYKPVIRRLVLEDDLTATLILDEIRPLGYTGGYSILKHFVRTVRPRPAVKVTTSLEHPPGSPAEVDWSPHTSATQDSLPAAGQLCRAGLSTRWVPMQGFNSSFLLAQALPGARHFKTERWITWYES